MLKKNLTVKKPNNLIKIWAKDWNRHHTKEDIQTSNKHMKRSSMSYVIRDLQIKMTYHSTSIRIAKIQNTDNTQMLARMWSNRNSHSLLVGIQNGTGTLKDSLAVSYKIKHTFTMQTINCSPWYSLKWAENLCTHKKLHMNVYSSLIHNCQNLEATKMSFNT